MNENILRQRLEKVLKIIKEKYDKQIQVYNDPKTSLGRDLALGCSVGYSKSRDEIMREFSEFWPERPHDDQEVASE